MMYSMYITMLKACNFRKSYMKTGLCKPVYFMVDEYKKLQIIESAVFNGYLLSDEEHKAHQDI